MTLPLALVSATNTNQRSIVEGSNTHGDRVNTRGSTPLGADFMGLLEGQSAITTSLDDAAGMGVADVTAQNASEIDNPLSQFPGLTAINDDGALSIDTEALTALFGDEIDLDALGNLLTDSVSIDGEAPGLLLQNGSEGAIAEGLITDIAQQQGQTAPPHAGAGLGISPSIGTNFRGDDNINGDAGAPAGSNGDPLVSLGDETSGSQPAMQSPTSQGGTLNSASGPDGDPSATLNWNPNTSTADAPLHPQLAETAAPATNTGAVEHAPTEANIQLNLALTSSANEAAATATAPIAQSINATTNTTATSAGVATALRPANTAAGTINGLSNTSDSLQSPVDADLLAADSDIEAATPRTTLAQSEVSTSLTGGIKNLATSWTPANGQAGAAGFTTPGIMTVNGQQTATLLDGSMLMGDGEAIDPMLDVDQIVSGEAQSESDLSTTAQSRLDVRPASVDRITTADVPSRTIAVAMVRAADKGRVHFDIRLDPPELGRVDVRMSLAGGGKVKAHLAFERLETLELFQRDSRALERALAEAGLNVDSGSLEFSLSDDQAERFASLLSDDQGEDAAEGEHDSTSQEMQDLVDVSAYFSNHAGRLNLLI